MHPGEKIVWSPRGAPHIRRYGTYTGKKRDGYYVIVFNGETDEKSFPMSEVEPCSLLEAIAWEVKEAEEDSE